MKRILLSWSSGKDSAWALHLLRQSNDYAIVGLVTTLNTEFDRVAMHGTRRAVLELQAAAAGLPLWTIPLPWPCSNDVYEARMRDLCARSVAQGVQAIAFGDLFLTDIRTYRERQLAGTGLEPLFPVWGLPTAQLARDMICSGLRARIACVDPKALPSSLCGREFDQSFLTDLPSNADACGENGEFHTCVYAGPMFNYEIPLTVGKIVERDGFVFADLLSEQFSD
jgi:uncharacterized protein (TIGR00290 family)